MATQQINGSVGQGGMNAPMDVEKVQTLLKNKKFYDGAVSKVCDLQTIVAIKKFQAQYMSEPDGRIDVNGVTWKKLTGVLPIGSVPSAQPVAAGPIPDFNFPFTFRPAESWHDGARRFGADRSHGRKHAGCDLYAPIGTPIYAIADGVVRRYADFYRGTAQLEIVHGDLLVRYAEIKPRSFTGKVKGTVKKGEKIAEVGKLKGISKSMLHIEIYTDAKSSAALLDEHRLPYKRRADLANPTPYLDRWVNNLTVALCAKEE